MKLVEGYKDGKPVTITIEDEHVYIESPDGKELWNDEYYDEESYGTIKLGLLNEGFHLIQQ